MQINKFLLIGVLCTYVISLHAQTPTSAITGHLKSTAGETVPAATVTLQKSQFWAVSDHRGNYRIKNVKPGSYSIRVKAMGFKTEEKNITVTAGQDLNLDFHLTESTEEMETVTINGRTLAQETNRQAFNVTAVDAKKLYNTTLDISGALDRVAGVRVRESGGVGSNFNLSLNGFSGNRIRFFIDGIPMDNFGSSFQINNIPINLADRVEVYKGVVPMWLGSDALGGAINIVTNDRYRNYADASYSYGSFNTHRSVLNAAVTSEKGLTFQLNAFQNYSDNDYKVQVEASDPNTGVYAPEASLRRFHDKYHNETVIASIGLVGKKYADKLLLGFTAGKNYREIQTGARMTTVFGAWHTRGNILMPSLKYKKNDLIKGLDVTINANYNLGNERNIDTASRRYDWFGNYKSAGSNGESSGGKTLSKYRNNNGLATAMLNYRLRDNHSLALSNVFSTFTRKGHDDVNPTSTQFREPKKTRKNVLGLGYSYDLPNNWSATVFGKYLYQKNEAGSGPSDGNSLNRLGYGAALSYYAARNLQLKASYEFANRLPESNEVFGDLINLEGNASLRPEKSNNINLGINYGFSVSGSHHFYLNANAIYRKADDFIYSRFNLNQTKLTLDNRDGVRTVGGDLDIRYSYKQLLSAGTSVTYQYLTNLQRLEKDAEGNYTIPSNVYKDRMPNIPYFFGNSDVSVNLKNVLSKGNNLNVTYNLLYVHAFWLYWPSQGGRQAADGKREVPQQLSHDLNLVYTLAKGRYNVGLECKNLTDTPLYDNFSLQKPGRGFYLNLRYFIN